MKNDLLDSAKDSAGNWKKFDSFAWHNASDDDSDNWAIFYTSNRDADLLTESNHATIQKEMAPFTEGEDPDCREESHSHWAVGHVDGFAIRVFKANEEPTDAFRTFHALSVAMENYPVLDESDFSEREYEACLENINWEGCSLFDNIVAAPEDWPGQVFSWLWDNNQGEVENTDGQGAYPSKESIKEALLALGMIKEEMESED